MTKKPFVFDNPKNTTQYFKVSIPEFPYRLLVKRSERIRKPHNMGCTDNLPDDYVETYIQHEVTSEVPMDIQQKAIEAVRKSIEDDEQQSQAAEKKDG